MAISKQVQQHENSVSFNTSSRSDAQRKAMSRIMSSSNHEASKAHFKVPVGDGPYVRAKQIQLVEKDPERAIALFWAAINAGDRVDSALKDMALVMRQQNRGEEAIQAILSFRHLCSPLAQESLDNVLLDLYKKCGRLDDQIELLKHKLSLIHKGVVFNGKHTKTARSQGRKFQISIRQEASRLLGNLGWAYMQLCNYTAAETVYRKALSIETDNNKLCNLGVCLLEQGKEEEAKAILERVTPISPDGRLDSESHVKSYQRSQALLYELRGPAPKNNPSLSANQAQQALIIPPEFDLWTHLSKPWEEPTFSNPASCTNPAANSVITNTDPAESKDFAAAPPCSKICNDQLYKLEFPAQASYDDLETTITLSTGAQLATPTKYRSDSRSFKREIGPPSTVQHSTRAKKSTSQGLDYKSGGNLLKYQNDIMKVDNISSPWDFPAMSSQVPDVAARRAMLLDGASVDDGKGIQGGWIERGIGGFGCCKDFSNSRKQIPEMDMARSFEHEYLAGASSRIASGHLDFSVVDKVIESVVSEAPSASDISIDSGAVAMEKPRRPSDDQERNLQMPASQDFGTWSDARIALPSLSTGVYQHRLDVFRDMAHDAALNA